jgi:hypothetical protein
MNGLRLRIARLAVALGVVSLIWACNAPFIPVPPPGATFTSELVSDGAGGMTTVWITHGDINDKAAFGRFFIFNDQTNRGVAIGAASDGTYVAPPIDGTMNDHIEIFFETTGGDRSATACLQLHEGPNELHCP